jgi:hypothetical protein
LIAIKSGGQRGSINLKEKGENFMIFMINFVIKKQSGENNAYHS